MATLKDEEEQKGQGTSQVLGQGMAQPAQPTGQAPQQAQSSAPAMIGSSATQTSAPVKNMPKQKAGTGTFANLKSYLQAAQGGGQQKVAQAAAQQVQRLGAGAQRGLQQAQEAFSTRMDAGTLSGLTVPGGEEAVRREAEGIISTARGTVYQAPQPTTTATKPQDYLFNGHSGPELNEAGLARLGDKASAFQEELKLINSRVLPMDYGPGSSNERAGIQQQKDREALYEKYGLNAPSETTTPQPAQPQQYFTPEQQQRFAEIINAQYGGPASLQQAGLYEQAAQSARAAQQAAQLTQTALGRGQLLKDIFGRNRDYKGKLDALLLNTSQQGVSDLQKQAEGAAKAQEVLQAEQNLSATRAAQRAAAIEQVRSGARTAFTEGRGAEEQAVEDRIDSLIKTPALDANGDRIKKLDAEGKPILDANGDPVYQTEWDRLPEYFREAIRKAPELNRATQEEGLKELERSSGLSIKRFDELPGQISSIQSRLQQLQRDIPQGTRIPGSASEAEQRRMRNQINELTKQLQGLQTEYSSYSDFGTQLKNLRDMNMNQVQLSPEEMAVLGVKSGEGLYNLGQGLIENVEARRERLITKDELSRQLALQQLAGLDLSKELQKDLLYTDLEKAGTQDLSSSLNTERIRELLNKEREDFKTRAEEEVLVGSGTKKVTRGNWSGTRKKTYYAEQSGKVADMLREAGYDVSAQDEEAIGSMLSDKQALENFLGATSTSRGDSGSMYAEGGARTAAGAATGAGIGAYFSAPWLGAGIGAAAGSLIGDNSTLSNFVGDLGGGRMSASSMARVGRGTAKELAIKDLQNKYKNYLEQAGFSNRLAASQDPQVLARMEGLKNLLGRKG
jgi:hypothetical protein